jgi:hypothetical protein
LAETDATPSNDLFSAAMAATLSNRVSPATTAFIPIDANNCFRQLHLAQKLL